MECPAGDKASRTSSPGRFSRFFTSIRERVVARVDTGASNRRTGAVASTAGAMAPRAARLGSSAVPISAALTTIAKSPAAVVYSESVQHRLEEYVNLLRGQEIENTVVVHVDEDARKDFQKLTLRDNWPLVYVKGDCVGGLEEVNKLVANGQLKSWFQEHQYDLIVIGGGSGGLAAAKEAARLGKKVACFDYVKPSTQDTTWGLGGTCVNVGCIPKKLMHQGALLGGSIKDAKKFGWKFPEGEITHNWKTMRDAINDHIAGLNWAYRVQLREKNVEYVNSYATFVGPHEVSGKNKKGVVTNYTATRFLVATGLRPKFDATIPGCKEYCISSDDIFSIKYSPGKTLCVGASYISLECAGFLKGIGLEVSVMVRSILLRGFDQQISEKIGKHMEAYGINFIRGCIPTKIEQLEPKTKTAPGRLLVHWVSIDAEGKKTEHSEEFNTVLYAIGREPQNVDVKTDVVDIELAKSGKIVARHEQTSVPWIYAIGDILEGKPELTPVAIQAGRVLARRIFQGNYELTEYDKVPTTVFTPLEYGCCGLSEEDAIKKYGQDNIIVYHGAFKPLEYVINEDRIENNHCYCKLICVRNQEERVVGYHILTPTAGEITQGFAIGLKLGAKKRDFDRLIGIHPTVAEQFTTLTLEKKEGEEELKVEGC
ncbi:unnamed protein product, partial [Mesorhabditis spiculigera]